jgi:hypothetical protein
MTTRAAQYPSNDTQRHFDGETQNEELQLGSWENSSFRMSTFINLHDFGFRIPWPTALPAIDAGLVLARFRSRPSRKATVPFAAATRIDSLRLAGRAIPGPCAAGSSIHF